MNQTSAQTIKAQLETAGYKPKVIKQIFNLYGWTA